MPEYEDHPDVVWDGVGEPITVTPPPEPQPTVEELEDDDRPVEIYQPGDSIDATQKILSPEKRQEILGRLAEFEFQLSALSPLMQGFVLAYLQNPTNPSACARLAGYAEQSAKVKASQLLADSRIQACIALGQLLREDRTMVTSERTINELAIIAFSNIADYEVKPGTNNLAVRDGVPEYALRAVSQAEYTTTVKERADGEVTTQFKVKIKLWSKTDALRMLALYQKLLSPEGGNVDNSKHLHVHEHNTWMIGDKKLTF